MMNDLRRRFERFLLKNRDKGISNLMLYIAIGNVAVYLLTVIDPSRVIYSVLRFDRGAILHGQIWRLVSFVFTYLAESGGNILLGMIALFCYFQFGKMLEQYWGKFKFNLYYLTGVVMIDLAALLFGGYASVSYLNLSLFLAVATIAPETRVLLMYVIPIKMKYMAWFYLGFTALQVVSGIMRTGFMGLSWMFPILALLNYFLFFGREILNILPGQTGYRRPRARPTPRPKAKPNPNWASAYQSKSGQKPYRHKCTVCGKTDTEYPGMEFRYCSKCSGYRCYCMEHINNHAHIAE